MKILNDISAQQISWVKSNKKALENVHGIQNLYYPESVCELTKLISDIRNKKETFDIIGYSSNTLFLPTYRAQHVICTKRINSWKETVDTIVCDCGVPVSKLSKWAVEQGYVGFEGLTDLPGTIAAGVYGNCGCRGCSVNSLVRSFTLLDSKNEIREYGVEDLKLQYRSSSLKRGELQGVILKVTLNKVIGNAAYLIAIADKNHKIRKMQQPSGYNNLGTTINGGSFPTIKGRFFRLVERFIRAVKKNKDSRICYPIVLKIMGKSRFIPYIYYWNRYMFLDVKSHELFNDYFIFLKSLYKDVRLEIEIKK